MASPFRTHCLSFAFAALCLSAFAQPSLQRIAQPGQTGHAAAVRVADGALIFTPQVSAPDKTGARAQAEHALTLLATLLEAQGSGLTQIARLNVYAASDAAVPAIEAAIAARFASAPPAVTLVISPLAQPGALVAFDAIAASSKSPDTVQITPHGALMPAGGKIFISGQAERGTDLASATRLTMEKLLKSVEHFGLKKTDVVQLKAFVRPLSDHAAAAREIAASFGGAPVPPVIFVEWQSDLFTEIELVASARSLPPPAGDTISYTFLPWLTRSPRYCHITHIAAGTPLIFIGGINGVDGTEPRAQMKSIFERLGSVLFEAGSSYRNLAKATYYLADPKAQAVLGEIRGVYYDPTRPPAASAVRVPSLGHAGRAAHFDLIAVPVGK